MGKMKYDSMEYDKPFYNVQYSEYYSLFKAAQHDIPFGTHNSQHILNYAFAFNRN